MARDADSSRTTKTEVAPSLTAELIFAANLLAQTEATRPGVDLGWIEAQRAQLGPEVVAVLPRFTGIWWPTMGLVDYFCWNGLFQDPDAFLDDVLRTPIEQFLTILFNTDLTVTDVTALLADPSKSRALSDGLSRFSMATPDAFEQLFRDPEGHRRALVTLIRGSDTPLFRQTYATLSAEAKPTVQALERRLLTEDALAVAESLRERPLKGPGSYAKVTFVPSRLMGHKDIISWGNGNAVFFLQLGSLNVVAPTKAGPELAEFLKVLSDPTRMDILRLLSCGPSFGKELASSLGLTTATVSRHLDQLKAAGLVREEKADANNVKRLRYVSEALDAQFARLRAYLLHS